LKTLLLFLACAVPAGVGLWLVGGGEPATVDLPDHVAVPTGEPVLSELDLADPYGATPFSGRVRRLEDVEVRIVESGYFRFYLHLGRLARHDGHPQLEEVRVAMFDPPVEGRPNLKLTLRAPRVAGDPRQLLYEEEGAPRTVTLAGGVEARDAAGRPILQVESLRLDLSDSTVKSEDPVLLRMPDRDAEVSGRGLFADLVNRRAALGGPVSATATAGGRRVRVACQGEAAVGELERDGDLLVTLAGGTRIEYGFGAATCASLRATVARGKDADTPLREAALTGNVELDLDPAVARGLERLRMAALRVEGERRIECTGPLSATWRGALPALGPGEREVRLEAGGAALLLRRGEDGKVTLEEGRFAGGFLARDRAGAGEIRAKRVTWLADGAVLEAAGEVSGYTPEATLAADRVRIEAPAKDELRASLEGTKRVTYVADGKLGPLGEAARGTLVLTARGPLVLARSGTHMVFTGEDDVVARIGDLSGLDCGTLRVEADGGTLLSVEAGGGVHVADWTRDAKIEGAEMRYAGGAAHVTGTPARVSVGGRGEISARTFDYHDDRTFRAEGDVAITGTLAAAGGTAGRWQVTCARAEGVLAADGQVSRLRAEGALVAHGPAGELVKGETFTYDGATGVAVLTGEPAVVARGDELRVQAPGFDVRLDAGEVVSLTARGEASAEYAPPASDKAPYRRWRIRLGGPATFRGDELVVEEGGSLEAFDADDKPVLRARAGRVAVTMARKGKGWTAGKIEGGRGVEVESLGEKGAKVTADRLSFAAGSRDVEIFGNARVEAKGWPREVRFEHLLFTLEEKGIDLKKASEIDVR